VLAVFCLQYYSLTESKAYRAAHNTFPPSAYHAAPLRTYHSLNPHPALSPFPDADLPEAQQSQVRNETVFRQLLVQGALAVLLPTEDLQNSCLRTLVSDIIADLILGQGISGKACEGWFLHETVIKVVDVIKSHIEPKARGEEIEQDTRSRLEKFGLLSTKAEASPPHSSNNNQSRASALFWRLLQYAYLLFLLVRFVIVGLFRARSMPSRSQSSRLAPPSPFAQKATSPSTPSQSWSTLPSAPQRPILEYRLFALVSTLLESSTRMPWLIGLLSLCRHGVLAGAGRLGAADGLLDK
jgi:PXA domain